MILNEALGKALSFLPVTLAREIENAAENERDGCDINEIRLRSGCAASLSVDMKNRRLPYICTPRELSETMKNLCGGSVYAYADTIKRGFVNIGCGIRVGVCGRAVSQSGDISGISEVASINIRIPRKISGVAEELAECFCNTDGGILVYSPPGVGKTTLLRDFIAILGGRFSRRVAVIDTRGELEGGGFPKNCLADLLSGYPKGIGIEIATRAFSPELIVCDEIGAAEAEAILCAQNSGVRLVASAHAATAGEAARKKSVSPLIAAGVFDTLAGISRKDGERNYNFEFTYIKGGSL